jgi:hypothetical protein
MSLNQWAADTYPVVQQHLEKARSLRNMLERRGTTN